MATLSKNAAVYRLQGSELSQQSAAEVVYGKAAQLGIVAGLRSMTPFAVLAWADGLETEHKAVQNVTALLALGEIIGDKLPATPSRLKTGPLLGRLVVGAVAGALLCQRAHVSPVKGAMRGALGAALGSVAGYAYRSVASQSTGIPDVLWALIEDGVALGLGMLVVKSATVAE